MFENLEKCYLSVFPALKDQPAVYVNMNDFYARHRPVRDGKSIFLDPSLTQAFLKALHKSQGVAYSFGGYLENREDLWSGSYMEPHKAVHLGIDVNAPARTEVAAVHACRVVKIVHDPDQNGGWGAVIVFELDHPIGDISYFLYAHLSKDDVRVAVGDSVLPGQAVASLGTPEENGGWYEHLHVQAMTGDAWALLEGCQGMDAFDGYDVLPCGTVHHLSPNPAPLLFMPS